MTNKRKPRKRTYQILVPGNGRVNLCKTQHEAFKLALELRAQGHAVACYTFEGAVAVDYNLILA
jgi:hypothetical protein